MALILTLPRPLFLPVLVLVGLFYAPLSSWGAQLSLSWRDNSTNENGFIIERRIDTPVQTFAAIGRATQNATSYLDTTVTVGVRYCYRVQSFNTDGASTYSNQACGTVPTTDPPVSLLTSVVGQGKITSSPAGISCAPTCSIGLVRGTVVVLTANPATGWQLQTWGGSCTGKTATCSVTMDQAKNVSATFAQTTTPTTTLPKLGTFRNGVWWIDNGNGKKEACTIDACGIFGTTGDLPVVGRWVKGGQRQIGVFRRGAWYLDNNGNRKFDGCSGGDSCFSFGSSGQKPVPGDINGDGQTDIGTFSGGNWYFDTNGNRRWDGCAIDTCVTGFGYATDQPVIGDWDGDGREQIGVFSSGRWYLDYNGNRQWDGCTLDKCLTFGATGDLVVVGDWYGDRRSEMGTFRSGQWHMDDGDGTWEACTLDKCATAGAAGDLPIVK